MKVHVITCSDDLPEMFYNVEQWLSDDQTTVSIDTETGSVDKLWNELPLTGRGFCRLFQIGTAEESYVLAAQDWHSVVDEMMRMVKESKHLIVFANWQYDCHVMEKEGWTSLLPYQVDDVIIMHQIVRPKQTRHGLKPAAVAELGEWAGFGQGELKAIMNKAGWTWETIPTDQPDYCKYAGMDTSLTCKLWDAIRPTAGSPMSLAYEKELAYSHHTYAMERRGMAVSSSKLRELDAKWSEELEDLGAKLAGYGITKPRSSQAVELAFRELGFEPEEFTDTGAAKLDKVVLAAMKKDPSLGDAAEHLLRFRRVDKWLAVYVNGIARKAVKGKVHPSIKTMGARTGRSSVTDPPLQTIPKDKDTRGIFIPDPGCEFWSVDYDSQEARILADLSGEPALIELFTHGDGDIHQLIADELGIERNVAKTVVYAKLFGAGDATLGAAMGGGAEEGLAINALMREKFPRLELWFDSVIAEGMRTGCCTLPDGRQLYVPQGEEYKLINYSIQGRGALILKEAALELAAKGYGENMVMVVHDEILFQFPEGRGKYAIHDVCNIMRSTLPSGVPLTVQAEGPLTNWGEKYD